MAKSTNGNKIKKIDEQIAKLYVEDSGFDANVLFRQRRELEAYSLALRAGLVPNG